jgi:hypothetical protein
MTVPRGNLPAFALYLWVCLWSFPSLLPWLLRALIVAPFLFVGWIFLLFPRDATRRHRGPASLLLLVGGLTAWFPVSAADAWRGSAADRLEDFDADGRLRRGNLPAGTPSALPAPPVLPPSPFGEPGALPAGGGAGRAAAHDRIPVAADHRELKDERLSAADVLYNLRRHFLDGGAAVACLVDTPATPGLQIESEARLATVSLEGVHQHGAGGVSASAAPGGRPAAFGTEATLYFRGTVADGPCKGRTYQGEALVQRLGDGTWFSPSWRRALVKRQ